MTKNEISPKAVMKGNEIRAKAVCVVRHEGKILLIDTHAPDHPEIRVLIPVGGRIEFGEYSKDTAMRETLEEIGADVVNLRFMGVIENMFSHEGIDYHEHIFAYEGDFADQSLYQQEEIHGKEDSGWEFVCRWVEVDLLKSKKVLFFPTQMLDWL